MNQIIHHSESSGEEIFTVTLKAQPDSTLIVRSAELVCPHSRVRFSFGPDHTPELAFVPTVARRIRDLTERVVAQRGMLVLPDFVLDLSAITLSDCRVICADVADGGNQIMIRFNSFAGDLLTLFSKSYAPRRRLAGAMGDASDASDQVVELVQKAYLPLADFADHVAELRRTGAILAGTRTSDALFELSARIQSLEVFKSLAKDILEEEQRAGMIAESERAARLN